MIDNPEQLDTGSLLQIIELLDLSVAIFDHDLRLILANQKFLTVHRFEQGELMPGTSFDETILKIYKLLVGIDPEQALVELTSQAKSPDGKLRERYTSEGKFFRYCFTALNGGNVMFSVQNITARRVQEKLYKEKSEQLEGILQEIAEGVNIYDIDNKLVLANQGFMDMYQFPAHLNTPGTPVKAFGRSPVEVIGRWSRERLGENTNSKVKQHVESTGQKQSTFTEDLTDGRTIEVRRRRTPNGFLISTYDDISERLAASKALQRSELRYKAIIEDQTEMISRTDRDLNVTFANKAYKRTYLRNPEKDDVIGLNILSLIADENARNEYQAKLRSLTIKDPIIKSELLEHTADGTMRWQAWADRALFDDNGQHIGYQSVGRDVTDQKVAEEALAANSKERQSIVDGAIDAIVTVGLDRNIREFNPAAEKMFGYSTKEICGQPGHRLLAPELREVYQRSFDRFLEGKENIDKTGTRIELEGMRKDGTVFPMERVLVDASNDSQSLFVGYMRDLTEQKIAEEALAANYKERQSIIDCSFDAIMTFDAEGKIREFNPAAELVFGYSAKEVVGTHIGLLTAPEDRKKHATRAARILRGEEKWSKDASRHEIMGIKKDGTIFPMERTAADASNGSLKLFVAYVRDLTEQKRIAAELEQQRQAMAQSEKMSALGSLLANVSHELNNPLSVVIGQSDLLKELAPNESVAKRAERIKGAAERCARIVRTFLAMVRQKPPKKNLFSLREPILEALELVEYGLKTSAIVIIVDIDDGLPPMLGDATQIGQILSNLLVNAQQALSECPQPRKIKYSARLSEKANEVVISVADNGTGVPPDQANRIFEPFYTTKKEGSGTGIGLAIAHNIAVAHGGGLRLRHSSKMGGATFELRLPVYRQTSANIAVPETEAKQEEQKTINVLVVDDEIDVAQTVADQLELCGYQCVVADSARAALSIMGNGSFDAIISDLRMPEIDGPDFLKQAEAKWPGSKHKFGFFTGDSLSATANRFLTNTGAPYIEKPFSRLTLQNLVKDVLSNIDTKGDGN